MATAKMETPLFKGGTWKRNGLIDARWMLLGGFQLEIIGAFFRTVNHWTILLQKWWIPFNWTLIIQLDRVVGHAFAKSVWTR